MNRDLDCDSAIDATASFAAGAAVTGSTVSATLEAGEVPAGTGAAHSVWYSWVAPQSISYTVSTFGSLFDTLLAVYVNGTGVIGGATLLASNDNCASVMGTSSCVSVAVTAGQVIAIQVDGYNGAAGAVTLSVTAIPTTTATMSYTPSPTPSMTYYPPPINDNFAR